VRTDGGPLTNNGAGTTINPQQIGGSAEPGMGTNPYSGLFFPMRILQPDLANRVWKQIPTRIHRQGFFHTRSLLPVAGNPLFTTNADGPELKLIAQQLTGSDNYSNWSREFRRALVTKDKEGFNDGMVPVPSDKRMAQLWKKCNQLVRTWIGNCIASEVVASLPSTEDSK